MTCKDEAQKVEAKWEAVEDADLELAAARTTLENSLKESLVACSIGALGGLTGNALVLLGGGAACITALFNADNAAAEYEYAVAKSKLAHQRHNQALVEELMCLSHCSPQDPP